MFARRTHSAIIALGPDEERLFRLPPMSNGRVSVKVFRMDTELDTDPLPDIDEEPTEPPPERLAREVEVELRHSQHLSVKDPGSVSAVSLWHDDLWRVAVRRIRVPIVPAEEPRAYRIQVSYTSQLPIIEREIPVSFFHDGFEANYNRQQYISASIEGHTVSIKFTPDLRELQGLEDEQIELDISDLVEFHDFRTTSVRLDIGAGPSPNGSGPTVFFSIRLDFAAGANIEQDHDVNIDLPAFTILARLYLQHRGNNPIYIPTIEAELFFDKIDDIAGADGDEKKEDLEKKLSDLQFKGGISRFGAFLKPWLVGGAHQIASIRYAAGPGDLPRPDGIVEPATGTLIVGYVGPRAKPRAEPVILDPTGGAPSAPVDDGAIRLFDLPDEEPDPEPGGGGLGPFGGVEPLGPRPNIGALRKIDHIVVLMQENRSFDQVLGYLSRDGINPAVDGLAPPDAPGAENQVNRFGNRTFPVRKADPTDPPRARATAWPSFATEDPGHGFEDVLSQMGDNMGGFVRSFAERLKVTDPLDRRLRLAMDFFGPDQLPVYGVLAREFGICDSWYTAHAGPTWPNRFVLMTGDLNRDQFGNLEINNPDVKTMIPIQRRTLFDHLDEAGASWRVFEHGFSFLRLFGKYTFDTGNIVPFDDRDRGFEALAVNGELPQVTLIEPDYIDLPPGNDDHPPADMADGQNLVNRIVQALITSPAWERTLLVITYDEHGGFYDHKQPPDDAPPLGDSLKKLGPRVPTFVISPLVQRGAVFHSRFDHTSIGATILRRFAGPRPPRVSPRLDAARDLREALTLADSPRPRTDFGSLGLPTVFARPSPERRLVPERARRIGQPKGEDDFHWMLAAMRLIIGEPPKVSRQRKRVLARSSGQLLYFRDRTRDGTGDVANPSVIGLGGWQNFRHVFSGGNSGVLYAVDQDGRLLFFRDKTQDGTGDVANPSVIGLGGWQSFRHVFSGGDGILYAVDQAGRLLFFRDTTENGIGDVATPSVIGLGGWQNFRHVFSGGDGILYAVDQGGRLLFFRDRTQNGTGDVASPSVIGLGGWQSFGHVFSGGNGIIYAVDQDGRLLFFRDKTQDGTGDVANPSVIGLGGWQSFRHVFSGGNGILYAVVA